MYLLLDWIHPFLNRLRCPQIWDWYRTTKTARKTEDRRVLNEVLENTFTGLSKKRKRVKKKKKEKAKNHIKKKN